jgi:hypothetical protein
MRWPLTVYTNRILPKWAAGAAIGPVILIRPHKRGDEGLYRHELTHVRQSLAGLLVVHAILYLLVPRYRLWCEVQAYREQLKHSPGREALFGRFIAERYRLKITPSEAAHRLRTP